MKLLLCFGILVAALSVGVQGQVIARCLLPSYPKNGDIRCDSLNGLEGDKCVMACLDGYNPNGTTHTECKNGKWTPTLGTCEAVMCQKPIIHPLAIVDPPSCLTGPSPFATHCSLDCPPGYYDRAGIYCDATGRWQGRNVDCKDRQPPQITCPPHNEIVVYTDLGKATTNVTLPKTSYKDNSQSLGGKLKFNATLNGKPVSLKEDHILSLSRRPYFVRYSVSDESGNQAACRFMYVVKDKELPKIKCPKNITAIAKGDGTVRISWDKPVVTDNSGHYRMFCNYVPGSIFYEGEYDVECRAHDTSYNEAICKFHVTVKLPCKDDDENFPTIILDSPPPKRNDACSIPAADLKKCDQQLSKYLPNFYKWKSLCRKTCKTC